MTKKAITTVRLTDDQLAFIKAEAQRLGVSEGEIVRRIIDRYRKEELP